MAATATTTPLPLFPRTSPLPRSQGQTCQPILEFQHIVATIMDDKTTDKNLQKNMMVAQVAPNPLRLRSLPKARGRAATTSGRQWGSLERAGKPCSGEQSVLLKCFPPLYLVFQGSPVQDSREDVKPTSQELLNSLLSRDNGELVHTVKEEPGSPHSGLPTAGSPHSGGGGLNGHLENYSPPQLPPSPHSPVSPTLHRPQYLPPSGRSLSISLQLV